MKKIIICGDSFNSDDPDYGDLHWTHKLKKLIPDSELINLSVPGASNFLIHAQIDHAITLNPDWIIVGFTSSLRNDFKYKGKQKTNILLDRFFKLGHDNSNADLISVPYSVLEKFKVEKSLLQLLKQYLVECLDLDIERLKNYYIISDSLNTLADSNIKFLYTSGGFDHPSFMKDGEVRYQLQKFKSQEMSINLWDFHKDCNDFRPYFHILDDEEHWKFAKYLGKIISESVDIDLNTLYNSSKTSHPRL
jgi:hypothetical protein